MYGGKSSTGCESLYKKRTRSRRARTLKASRTDRFFHTCSLLTSQIYIFQLILSPHTEFHQSTRKTIRPEQTSPGSWFLLRSFTVSRSRGGDFFSKNRNEKRKSDPLSSRRQRSRERERAIRRGRFTFRPSTQSTPKESSVKREPAHRF